MPQGIVFGVAYQAISVGDSLGTGWVALQCLDTVCETEQDGCSEDLVCEARMCERTKGGSVKAVLGSPGASTLKGPLLVLGCRHKTQRVGPPACGRGGASSDIVEEIGEVNCRPVEFERVGVPIVSSDVFRGLLPSLNQDIFLAQVGEVGGKAVWGLQWHGAMGRRSGGSVAEVRVRLGKDGPRGGFTSALTSREKAVEMGARTSGMLRAPRRRSANGVGEGCAGVGARRASNGESRSLRLDRDGDLLRDDPHADPVRRLPLRDGHRDGHDVSRRAPSGVPPRVPGGQAGSGSTGAKSRFRSASAPSSRRIRFRSA